MIEPTWLFAILVRESTHSSARQAPGRGAGSCFVCSDSRFLHLDSRRQPCPTPPADTGISRRPGRIPTYACPSLPLTMSSTTLKEESPAESSAMAQEREIHEAPPTATPIAVFKGKNRASADGGRHIPSIPPMYHSMIAGAGAGLVSSIATCPLDVIKTRLQASSAPAAESVKSLVATIWRTSGIRGMYRGLGPTILGYLPTWGIYFSVYDDIKDKLGKSIGAGLANGQGTGTNEQWLVHILAAMTAGATGTIATNPLWVIKTRFMVSRIVLQIWTWLTFARSRPNPSCRQMKDGINTRWTPVAPFIGKKGLEHSTKVWHQACWALPTSQYSFRYTNNSRSGQVCRFLSFGMRSH